MFSVFRTQWLSDSFKISGQGLLRLGHGAHEIMPRLLASGVVAALPSRMHESEQSGNVTIIIKTLKSERASDMYFPRRPNESNHYCIVCGKQDEFKLRDHLTRVHNEHWLSGEDDLDVSVV